MREFTPSLRDLLTPFARNLLVALLIVALAMGGLHALARLPGIPPFWARLFNLDAEFTLGPLLTATVLLAAGLVALANGLWAILPRLWQRLYWLLLGGMLVYLSLDEYFSIHESILAPTRGASGPWIVLYTTAGVTLLAALFTGYRLGFSEDSKPFGVLFAGLGVMALGGIGLEAFNFFLLCAPSFLSDRGLCHRFTGLEETVELIGVVIILAAVVSYAQVRLDTDRWRLTGRAVSGLIAVWLVALVGNIWLFPTLEARLLAQPVKAEYLDGTLSLAGYRMSHDVLHPESDVTLRLYWQAEEHLSEDYFVSAHLVTRPDAVSVAQADRPLGGHAGWRTTTWRPGVTMKDVVQFHVPGDIPTPASYWLIVRVWWPTEYVKSGLVYDSIEYVPLTQADRQLLDPETMVLLSLPAIPEEGEAQVGEPPNEARYQFADGFTLTGYALPETGVAGQSLPVVFWWTTETDIEPALVQFTHLFHSNGEDVFTYDQPPFGGTFPTSDWPADIEVQDTLDIPLPEDMPPGEYRVHTGMYILETGERRPVTSNDGQPIQDNSIYLGTVTIEQ
jgi:hypothetical protein